MDYNTLGKKNQPGIQESLMILKKEKETKK